MKVVDNGIKKTGKPHEPIEIPVPKRGEVEDLLRRTTQKKAESSHFDSRLEERAPIQYHGDIAGFDGRRRMC